MIRSITNFIAKEVFKRRRKKLEIFINNPLKTQNRILFYLLDKAKNTEYGRKYNFSGITSYEEYAKKVPVIKYEDIAGDIDRIRNGEQNIFWPDKIEWFAKSSGTTNDRSKYIPITKENLENNHFKAGKDMLGLYFKNNPNSKIFKGEFLKLGGSMKNYKSISFDGDLSAIVMKKLPMWAAILSIPKNDISLLENWGEKSEKTIKYIQNKDIRGFLGVPSWLLIIFKRLLEETGKDNLLELYPNMEVFFHGGISFTPYEDIYNKLLPDSKFKYVELYNASEGFFGIQYSNDTKDLLLLTDHGVFFEFIDMRNFNNGIMNTISLEKVEMGVNYAMLITTNSGLFRYVIGDTVRFTSIKPFTIKITGRTKYYINAFGEELMFENAEMSLKNVCKKTNAIIEEYIVAPVYMTNNNKGKHQWVIEFVQEPDDMEVFINTLDKELSLINSDYSAKRETGAMDKLEVIKAPRGIFYKWLESVGKLGGQNKIPKLCNERLQIDSILKLF